jgi:hypothetical protein
LVVQGVARGKFSATCGLRSALEWSRRELVPATWRLGWLVLQSGLLEVSGFWLKWVDLFFYYYFFFLSGFVLLMPGIDVWVMVAVGFDV